MKCARVKNKYLYVIILFLMLTSCGLYPKNGWSIYYMPNLAFSFSNIGEDDIEKYAEYVFVADDSEVISLVKLLESLDFNLEKQKRDASYNVKLRNNATGDVYLVALNTIELRSKQFILSKTQQKKIYEILDKLVLKKQVKSRWKKGD